MVGVCEPPTTRVFLIITALLICSGVAIAQEPVSASSGSEVRLTVDADTVIRTMSGGFGASWHAIEQPIAVERDRSHGGSAWGGNQVTGEQKDRPELKINPVGRVPIVAGRALFSDELPPMSVTLFSTWNLKHSSRGITPDADR